MDALCIGVFIGNLYLGAVMGIFDWFRKKEIKHEKLIDMPVIKTTTCKFAPPVQLGGPGTCRYCNKDVSNLSLHETRCQKEIVDDSMAAMKAALEVLERAKRRREQDKTARGIRG